MKRTSWLLPPALLAAALFATTSSRAQRAPERGEPSRPADNSSSLSMTPAVACLSIDAQGNYEPLPGAALSNEEKLVIYYRPLNYQLEHDGTNFHIHLVQDGLIRARGKAKVLQAKQKMIDEDWKGRQPRSFVYMRSMVSLKGMPPGEYEFEITLRDLLAPGEPTARQTLNFRVVPPGARDEKGEVKP
jgi:hypothetical protein